MGLFEVANEAIFGQISSSKLRGASEFYRTIRQFFKQRCKMVSEIHLLCSELNGRRWVSGTVWQTADEDTAD